MKSLAAAATGGLLGWLKDVLGDGRRGRRRSRRRSPHEPGASRAQRPISPLLSNIYLRRFILGWQVRGYARRFQVEIVAYADDAGRAPSATMRAAVEQLNGET